MSSFAGVVLTVQQAAKADEELPEDVSDTVTTTTKDSTTVATHLNVSGSPNPNSHYRPKTSSSSPKRRSMQSSYKQSPMPYPLTTPSERTGPPRSISFNSLPNSRVVSRTNSRTDGAHPPTETTPVIAGPSIQIQPDNDYNPLPPELKHTESQFRDALEYEDPDQREREREYLERVERRKLRDSRLEEWNPIKWLTDSPRETPKEEHPRFDLGAASENEKEGTRRRPKLVQPLSARPDAPQPQWRLSARRSNSLPSMPKRQGSKDKDKRTNAPRWGRLRSLIPAVISQSHSQTSQAGGSSALAPQSVNITDELIAGGLSTLMLKLWFERDEKGHRRVPILLHRLRIRISDSLHPLDGNKAVFRIECVYANGAAKWVIYRQLREFLSLHTHYAFSNAYNRNIEALPEFPKTSLPYLKFLKKEGREKGNKVGHAEFTRMQREVLENYLVGLIRAVMFHSTVNRLAAFLEISALSISLAQSGGVQYKAGFLHLEISKGVGLGHKSASRRTRNSQKWCAVRESYLVISEELGELTVFDVFLFDSDFKIERPTRYYRQGLHLLRDSSDDDEKKADKDKGKGKGKEVDRSPPQHQAENDTGNSHLTPSREADCISTLGSIKSKMSKVFKRKKAPEPEVPSRASGSGPGRPPRVSIDDTASVSTASSHSERPPTPMLDPSTNTNPLLDADENHNRPNHPSNKKIGDEVSKHTFYIENGQMKLKINAKNERQMLQWIAALEKADATCHFTRRNRFDSFAPIRLNVAAQWLVDGRDYFWNLSRAILLAKESIYIHDWWLSPELQLRRPGKERYRLDKLLQKKAHEGVKIYIILYHEVSSRTTPTDSGYTKQRMMGLHGENIMVQRSPSHFQTGTFYWAHHEKLCVIDQAIAFMGGLDMCFGRWDTPQHILTDDPDTLDFEASEQVWPGKDYSNGRIADFHTLNKPEEDMYDRSKVPRMPWHDVGMQVVGQPARDLARHFTERWNHLLRIKNHSRPMPCLLPPSDFKPGELSSMGLTGTCEMQIVRSAGPWSLGTPDRIEHSVQNAYLKAIQLSEHFVYIENQFFITSTVVNDVKVENKIGDAIVHRAIRAHHEGTPWKCCIVIPVLPGFPFPIDHSDASAIRIIVECQNRTICRGPNSIFGRLRKEGIDPSDYISVFSLRNWAKLRGNVLTTEQVYIHAKICIVDDRLAIIGSANINERSQRGDRDSELASVIRDTDMIDGHMAGKPFKVGRFAHSLRVRLMREHIGVDVDSMCEEDLMAGKPQKPAYDQQPWDPDQEEKVKYDTIHVKEPKKGLGVGRAVGQAVSAMGDIVHTEAGKAIRRVTGESNNQEPLESNVGDKSLGEERTMESRDHEKVHGFPSSIVPTMEEKAVMEPLDSIPEGSVSSEEGKGEKGDTDKTPKPQNGDGRESQEHVGSAESKNQDVKTTGNAQVSETKHEHDEIKASRSTRSVGDPSTSSVASGTRVDNGELYGAPADASRDATTDDQPPHAVSGKNDATETEEKAVHARSEIRKHLSTKFNSKTWTLPTPTPKVDPHGFEDPISDEFWKKVWVACAVHNTEIYRKVFHAVPDDLVTTWKQYKDFILHHERLNKPCKAGNGDVVGRVPSEAGDEQAPDPHKSAEDLEHALNGEKPGFDSSGGKENLDHRPSTTNMAGDKEKEKERKKSIRPDQEPFEAWEREEMEKLLGELRGHLVIYPTRFLEGEDIANNFLFNADRLLPLQIYN